MLLGFTVAASAVDIMPLSEVKEGMTGVGQTVFKGNKIEEFQVEILGVLRNYLPQQSLILGVLKGNNLEQTGVMAGMSGSPVFINGKMVGAVAYSWPFSKTPIAGITPIESMMQSEIIPREAPPSIVPPVEVANYYNFENLLTSHWSTSPTIRTDVSRFGKIELTPIATPLTISGSDPAVLERFTPVFSALGMQAVQGGSAAGADPSDPASQKLEPGSPVSVQLITGDLDIGAIGTVTYRDANKVLAFGHPFFNLGPTDFPMATAKIYAVVPSLYSSFKVGASGTVVGSIKQDLHSAIFGIVGSKSPMIPVNMELTGENGDKRAFHFEVADHKLLSPVLIDFAFQNSVQVTQLGLSESTLRVTGSIGLKEQPPIAINNIFSGASSFANASQYVATILYTLMTNEFKHVDVQNIDIKVESTMKRQEAELSEVWLDKTEVRRGDDLRLRAMYRPMRGEAEVQEFKIHIPEDLPDDELSFQVGGGQETTHQEYALYGKAYHPDSLGQLITVINSLRSNDRIYVKAYSNEPTLVLKGQFLDSLPTSALSVLSSSQTVGSSQKVDRLALWEDSRKTDYFITGTKSFAVKVLPGQN